MEEQCQPLNGLTYGQVPAFLNTDAHSAFIITLLSHDILWDVFVRTFAGNLCPEPDTSAAEGGATGQDKPTIHN